MLWPGNRQVVRRPALAVVVDHEPRFVAWRQPVFLVCLEQLIGHSRPAHKEEKMMIAQEVTQETAYVGIDVAKRDFVVNIHGQARIMTYANDTTGAAELIATLKQIDAPVRIAMEPTGGCELALWICLEEAGFYVRQICAAHIKSFRDSLGQRAKTDIIDAKMIAAFLAARPEVGRSLPAKNLRRIKALATKRRQVVASRMALLCQVKQHTDDDIVAMTKAMIGLHSEQIDTLDKMIAELISTDETFAEKKRLLRSFVGFGPVVTATVLAEMPELGTLAPGQASALAGLAPVTRQSGQWQGKSFVQGGRAIVRSALYTAARFAVRTDPHFETFFDRLIAKGKPYKVAITAVARKLLEAANIVLKRRSEWKIAKV